MLQWHAWESDVAAAATAASSGAAIELELASDPSQRDYGTVSEAVACLDGRSVHLRLLWPEDAQALGAGHALCVEGSFSAPALDEGGRWNHTQGFAGMLAASTVQGTGYASGPRGWVAGLRDTATGHIAKLDARAAGLLAGIVVGDRTLYASTELEQDFRTCGLAHLMAVSGTHLAVVTALASWVLALSPLKRRTRSLLLALLLGAYVALTCFAPSALRAFAMCAAVLAAAGFKRRNHALSALGACVVLFLALCPSLAFSLGFELSVLCMAGLLVLAPLIAVWVAQALPRRLADLSEALAATFAANLATLPVTVGLFCQVPLISPLSTVLVSPFITLALGIGIPGALLCSVVPAAGDIVLAVAGLVAQACAALVSFLADIPMACVPLESSAAGIAAVLFFAAAVALWVLWPLPQQELDLQRRRKRRRGNRAAVAACAFLPVACLLLSGLSGVAGSVNLVAPGLVASQPQVVMLDVGQGDAMLVTSGDAAVLVDTGQESAALLEALARHGVTRLDAVLLSHKDADHTGALGALAGVVEVGHVYIHADLLGSQACADVLQAASWVTKGAGAQGVRPGDELSIGNISLRLLAPQSGGDSGNDDSLIWLLSAADSRGQPVVRGLLTGDAEQEALEAVVGQVGDIDFLKVGHHGSRDAVSDEQMRILQPQLALISVGADNSYGHPTSQTLDVLQRGGAQVLRTDLMGDITIAFADGCMQVATRRQ